MINKYKKRVERVEWDRTEWGKDDAFLVSYFQISGEDVFQVS